MSGEAAKILHPYPNNRNDKPPFIRRMGEVAHLSIDYVAIKPCPLQYSFCYFKTSPEIIQLAVMLYVRFPLSLRNVGDLLHEVVASLTEWASLIAS